MEKHPGFLLGALGFTLGLIWEIFKGLVKAIWDATIGEDLRRS